MRINVTGTAVRIEEVMATVKLSRDLLEAFIVLDPGERISPADAMALLQRRCVTFGVEPRAVAELAAVTGPAEHRVAVGQAPRHGRDAAIAYEFRTQPPSLAPVIQPDGQADYRNLELIESVQPGQVLAHRTPPVAGQDGMSVNGLRLVARKPRDQRLVAGPGAMVDSEGRTIRALVSGTPKLDGPVVAVHRKVRVPGSVSLATGNIVFDGDVEVLGDVEPQMTVSATGSVTVYGCVLGARVQAGHDVRVAGKVAAGAVIEAGGDLLIGFAEFVTLQVGRRLQVREDLVHCEVVAKGAVEVGGSLVGGHVASNVLVEAAVIGSALGVTTVVSTDPAAPLREQLAEVQHERLALQGELEAVTEEVRRLRAAMDASASIQEHGPALYERLQAFQALAEQDAALAAHEETIQAELRRPRRPVTGRVAIHPEVELRFGASRLRVTAPDLADSTWKGLPVETLA